MIKPLQSESQRIPKLRFPGFSGGWNKNKLGEVAEIKRGLSSQQLNYVNGSSTGVRLLRINDFLSDDPVYIKETKDTKILKVKTNDLLIAGTGATAGIIFIVSEKFNDMPFSYNAPRIRVKDANYRFIYYYLKSNLILRQQKKLFVGNAQPFLDTDSMRGFKINTPQPPEQQKIASFLGFTDELINNLKEQKENLESYKKGMMQKIFSQEIRFKDDKGKDFPKWEEKKLGEMGTIRTSSVDKILNPDEKQVKLLNYMDVYRRDHIFANDMFQEITAKNNQILSCNLLKGDIVFTPSSETPIDIGHSAVVMEDLLNTVFSYHIVRFRPKKDLLISGFSAYAFKSFSFYKKLWRRAQGATRFTLSLETFNEVSVIIPKSLKEQQKIADFLTSIDKLLESKQNQITEAEQWKRGLMQGLFV